MDDKVCRPRWRKIREGLCYIFENGCLSAESYMELYKHVYWFCGGSPHNASPAWEVNGRHGIQIYKRGLDEFLHDYLMCLKRESGHFIGDQLVQYYRECWKSYSTSIHITHKVFYPLNKLWVKREDVKGCREIRDVHSLALIKWQDTFLSSINQQITSGLTNLIDRDRNREAVNTQLISDVIRSYIELGMYDQKSGEISLDVYKEHFEPVFLEGTRQYYVRESSAFLEKHPVREYMRKVKSWLEVEEKCTTTYLHESTGQSQVKICNAELIERHIEKFHHAFQDLLDDDDSKELGVVYKLVLRVHGCAELAAIFERHVAARGETAIAKCACTAIDDPHLYVRTIHEVYHKYVSLAVASFPANTLLRDAVDKGCRKFINSNAVTAAAGSSSRSSELLAKYFDVILRKHSNDADEIEDCCNQGMAVFEFINDEDIFQAHYLMLQIRRLIQSTSCNADSEASMVSKLKKSRGSTYPRKLQQAIREYVVSRDLQRQFKESPWYRVDAEAIDFTTQVYSSQIWPFQQSCEFVPPAEVERSCQSFAQFYAHVQEQRVLRWSFHMSNGIVTTNCFRSRYTIQVSTYQAAVLLLYNSADEYTYEQLLQATALPTTTLSQVLQVLVKSKLLRRSDLGADDDELQSSTRLKLSSEYNNKKKCININVPLKAAQAADDKATSHNTREERRHQIQAAITRIMKMRRTLKLRQLMSEVVDQVSGHFTPDVATIKKSIEDLIERDYLERSEDDMQTFLYKA